MLPAVGGVALMTTGLVVHGLSGDDFLGLISRALIFGVPAAVLFTTQVVLSEVHLDRITVAPELGPDRVGVTVSGRF